MLTGEGSPSQGTSIVFVRPQHCVRANDLGGDHDRTHRQTRHADDCRCSHIKHSHHRATAEQQTGHIHTQWIGVRRGDSVDHGAAL